MGAFFDLPPAAVPGSATRYDSLRVRAARVGRYAATARRVTAAVSVLSLMLLGACVSSAAPDADGGVTVRVGYFPNLTHAAGLLAVASGNAQRSLAPHTLQVTSFSAGPALIEALLAGEIDIAYVGPSPALNGYVKSRGTALRVIAGASSGGALFVVRPGVDIASPADLAGRRIATPQRGGTQDVALRFFAKRHGLRTSDEGGPVSVVPMASPDILSAFERGQIDAAWVPEPWGTRLLQETGASLWFDERSHWPDGRFATTHVIASSRVLERHPDLVQTWLGIHVDAVQSLRTDTSEALALVNAEIGRITTATLPATLLEEASRRMEFTYDPLPASVAVMADHAFQLGFLGTNPPDLANLYALDLLDVVLRERGLPPVSEKGGT